MIALSRTASAVAVAALISLVAGCGGGGDSDVATSGPAALACGTLPQPDPAASLPADFPKLDGQVLYEPTTQGATKIVFGRLARTDFVATRDELVKVLTTAGYTIAGTDQESVEAEAEFSGPHEGTIKVQPLCKGNLSIRYKLLN